MGLIIGIVIVCCVCACIIGIMMTRGSSGEVHDESDLGNGEPLVVVDEHDDNYNYAQPETVVYQENVVYEQPIVY